MQLFSSPIFLSFFVIWLTASAADAAKGRRHEAPIQAAVTTDPQPPRWQPTLPPMVVGLADEDAGPAVAPTEMQAELEAEQAQAALFRRVFRWSVGSILVLGFLLNWALTRRSNRRGRAQRRQAATEGLDVPPSLHPTVDVAKCMGCGACAKGCHGQVLALIDGVSNPVAPANCVGCGCCRDGCPVRAIQLVFGTAEKGVELPQMGPSGETNVPGLYIAGELGGMGLIANAFDQAIRAIDDIAASLADEPSPPANGRVFDVVIVGAGPAGLGAALRAKELGLSYACLEQDSWGGAIRNYPRGKIVMTRPLRVPLYGPVKLRETTKEALVELWTKIIETTRVKVNCGVRVERVEPTRAGHLLHTSRGTVHARRVLLAVGQAGTPRKLGVEGEERENVAYRMIDPEKWLGKKLVVVGGGDVACEVALALAEQPETRVALLCRSDKLTRPKAANRARIETAVREGRIQLLLDAKPKRIEDARVLVEVGARRCAVPADQVFVCAGGVPPTEFLRQTGVSMIVKRGES